MPFVIVHPREMEQIRKRKHAVVVDLRQKSEYLKYHYCYAINIPYEESECWLDKFNRKTTYILYCEHGNISLMAARRLSLCGMNVHTVVGGVEGLCRQYFND